MASTSNCETPTFAFVSASTLSLHTAPWVGPKGCLHVEIIEVNMRQAAIFLIPRPRKQLTYRYE